GGHQGRRSGRARALLSRPDRSGRRFVPMTDNAEGGPRTHVGPGAGLRLADAHADSLMWNRPLEQAGHGGHVDFPRLEQAGVALQCFTVVTGGFPYVGGFPLFARWRGWPAAAHRDAWSRYRFQVEALRRACEASEIGRASCRERV